MRRKSAVECKKVTVLEEVNQQQEEESQQNRRKNKTFREMQQERCVFFHLQRLLFKSEVCSLIQPYLFPEVDFCDIVSNFLHVVSLLVLYIAC